MDILPTLNMHTLWHIQFVCARCIVATKREFCLIGYKRLQHLWRRNWKLLMWRLTEKRKGVKWLHFRVLTTWLTSVERLLREVYCESGKMVRMKEIGGEKTITIYRGFRLSWFFPCRHAEQCQFMDNRNIQALHSMTMGFFFHRHVYNMELRS